MTTSNDIFGIIPNKETGHESDLLVHSVHIEMKRCGRNGYSGKLIITQSDQSTLQYNKMYRNKTLGQVRAEISKLKNNMINGGVLESNITINWSK